MDSSTYKVGKGWQARELKLDGFADASWKVAKEVVKDGIRINVYDMLEQRRLRNREKKKRRKARKAEVAEAAAASKATATVQSDEDVADAGDTEASNLHEILGSWSSQKADTEEKSNKDIPWKVHVSTDDRDSQRIDSFMSTLFPDFSDFRSDTAPMSTMKNNVNFERLEHLKYLEPFWFEPPESLCHFERGASEPVAIYRCGGEQWWWGYVGYCGGKAGGEAFRNFISYSGTTPGTQRQIENNEIL